MSQYYILDENGKPVEADLLTWGKFLEDRTRRQLARTEIGEDSLVSTVFVGMDDNIWETMVFGGINDSYQMSADTKDQALLNHEMCVKSCEGNILME